MIVAVTIRADRYEPLQIAPELAGVQTAVFDELKPMPPAGYTEVITGPARRATAAGRRLSVEPALVERLLAETAEGADALPLLALTLERLYRDFGDDGDLTVAEYESMGGMAQVVQTEVDNLLAADPEQRQAQLDILHDAFIPWLATINPDNDQPMRRLARWDDLPAASHPLIQAMVEKRLLVKDTRDGQIVVEVALESLLRQWRRAGRPGCATKPRTSKTPTAWNAPPPTGAPAAATKPGCWTGTRLADAETLAAKPGFRDRLDPTRDYLHASRARENDRIEAEEQRRTAELEAAQQLRQRCASARRMLAGAATRRRRRGAFQQILAARRPSPPPRRRGARQRALRRGGSTGQHPEDHHRPHRPGERCGVQPRRAPAGHAPATTARCGCGTPTPANPSATRSPATPARCTVWRSAPTGTGWPPPATTARCGCGTPTPASPSATRSPATPTR